MRQSVPTRVSDTNRCILSDMHHLGLDPAGKSFFYLRSNLPNARFVRGGEHGNFVRGDEAMSSMNECSPCMYRRCVADVRPIAHDMCSTLPARRVDLRRFTRVVGRMYLLCWNALRRPHYFGSICEKSWFQHSDTLWRLA